MMNQVHHQVIAIALFIEKVQESILIKNILKNQVNHLVIQMKINVIKKMIVNVASVKLKYFI
jgi:hypothetical protein